MCLEFPLIKIEYLFKYMIKTVVSCKTKNKQQACMSSGLHKHYSEVCRHTAALKFVTKLP